MPQLTTRTSPEKSPLQHGRHAASETALESITEEIKSALTFPELEEACDKAGRLEIHFARRECLTTPVIKSYLRITGATLSKPHARKMVAYRGTGWRRTVSRAADWR